MNAVEIRVGLEVLRDSGFAALRGKRVGLMMNPSAVDSNLESAYHILTHAEAVNVVALFGAEHGFIGAADAGEKVTSAVDARTGIPVFSLYGETYKPTPEMLENIDVIVCDVQDVGVRFYTYTWTISHILEAAGAAGVDVIVLDRPNPLGGVVVDGATLDPAVGSLVGRIPEPIQHGMTLGEHLRLINSVHNPTPANLSVIKCEGWRRDLLWDALGRVWVLPSPNMPHISTVRHYAGACLLEGTNLSEGRGTPLPFEIVGAPFIDGIALADHLNGQQWGGVRFRAAQFTPSASKFAGQACGGVQAHITDVAAFKPIRVWLGVIVAIRRLYADQFEWIPASFDRLIGSAQYRERIDQGASLAELTAEWDAIQQSFLSEREPYLLYE